MLSSSTPPGRPQPASQRDYGQGSRAAGLAFGSCRAAAARVAHTSGFSGSHGGRVEHMREAAGIATRAGSSLELHAYAAASLVEPRLIAIL